MAGALPECVGGSVCLHLSPFIRSWIQKKDRIDSPCFRTRGRDRACRGVRVSVCAVESITKFRSCVPEWGFLVEDGPGDKELTIAATVSMTWTGCRKLPRLPCVCASQTASEDRPSSARRVRAAAH